MNIIKELFNETVPDKPVSDNTLNYAIAITPRSGSSYLSDVLSQTKSLGRPGEFLPKEHIVIALKNRNIEIGSISVADHFEWVVKQTKTGSIFGQKMSFFQFQKFANIEGENIFNILFPNTKFIYLIRRSIIKQAISMYLADETQVFHNNNENYTRDEEDIEFNFEKIFFWVKHIRAQELGWQKYFDQNAIPHLTLYYEDIIGNLSYTLNLISSFIQENLDINVPSTANHTKIKSDKSKRFYQTIIQDKKTMSALLKILPNERL